MDRIEVQKLLKQLKSHCADPQTLLEQAEMAYMMAVDGYETEITGKHGPQMVLTRNPGVAVQAVQQKLAIIKYLVEYAGDDEADQKGNFVLNINLEAITDVTP